MAILKCKMCGGDLNVNVGMMVCECDYCGTKQTVPALDNEKKSSLFLRANRLRFNCEFDKASGIYESIVAEFPEEAEAYWGLVLCKYGIEYVDDPASGKKIPTCHRSSFESIMDDSNFEMVLEYSDGVSRQLYREEAKQIEKLRKSIIEVSIKEEPYDIFICYKETDENGDRTLDSVIAQDVYNALYEKGYRVFFSRITLEDKVGQEYEPYIFSALNSAKIMLVFGTDYEYFNAVWVKNEWSRFLQLIEKGEKKNLIPCYKYIDVYDMPREFARLQAQDMGKVGAIQDLLRGIEKLFPKETVKVETVITSDSAVTSSLLKRVFLFLEDGNFQSADEYCEKVLDFDPECAEAYLGKLMVEFKVKKQEKLKDLPETFERSINYQKAIRFADEKLKEQLRDDIKYISERKFNTIYITAISLMDSAQTEIDFLKAAEKFKQILGYKNSLELKNECLKKATESKLNSVYDSAVSLMNVAKTEVDFLKASEKFKQILEYKNSLQLSEECVEKALEAKFKSAYDSAVIAMNYSRTSASYRAVAERFESLGDYLDSSELAKKCYEKAESVRMIPIYNNACAIINENSCDIEKYKQAIEMLQSLNGWKDSNDKIIICENRIKQLIAFEEAERIERERKAEERRIEREYYIRLAREEKHERNIYNSKLAAIIAAVGFAIVAIFVLLQ